MRQLQFRLTVLNTLILGFALTFASTVFPDNAVSGNRDDVISDLTHIAARAHQYYRRPASLGGGGRSFVGLTADYAGATKVIPWPACRNAHGIYTIPVAGEASQVVIEGWWQDSTSNGNYSQIRIIVRDQGRPDSLYQVFDH